MSFNLFTFARKNNCPLLLDGAMGSLLQQMGINSSGILWTALANINNSELVYRIHSQYIKAGADIITANTFRTNPAAVKIRGGLDFKKLVAASVIIAKQAAKEYNILIAGSNAPAEDCYQAERRISKKELEYNHKLHIDELMKNGCDFILCETQSHFDEIKIICNYCFKNNIPYVLSMLVQKNMKLLSGENINEITKYVREFNPLCIGINCVSPSVFNIVFHKINFHGNWGMYLNLLEKSRTKTKIKTAYSASEYSLFIKKYLSKKPSFIGGCCGSNPNHIKRLREILDEKFIN